MSDSATTPLLHADRLSSSGLPTPAAYGQTQDHPAFLRACHSPWRWLPQNTLCYVRGAILAYLIAVSVMVIDYKVEEKSDYSDWIILFQFETISFGLVLAYHAVVFAWTYTHLYFPHIEDHRSGWEYHILRGMSLPPNMASLRKQFYFTLFYFTSSVFATVNTILYWFVTLPHRDADDSEPPSPQPSGLSDHLTQAYSPMRARDIEIQLSPAIDDVYGVGKTPFTDLLGEGWFKAFVYLNLFAISTGIMLFETFLLNSIKRPLAVGAHIFGLLFFSGLYIGWASIGKVLTGADAFFWLDEGEAGSREAVVANCIGFVLLSPIVFSLIYGFIAIREAINKSAILSRINHAAAQAVGGHEE